MKAHQVIKSRPIKEYIVARGGALRSPDNLYGGIVNESENNILTSLSFKNDVMLITRFKFSSRTVVFT